MVALLAFKIELIRGVTIVTTTVALILCGISFCYVWQQHLLLLYHSSSTLVSLNQIKKPEYIPVELVDLHFTTVCLPSHQRMTDTASQSFGIQLLFPFVLFQERYQHTLPKWAMCHSTSHNLGH